MIGAVCLMLNCAPATSASEFLTTTSIVTLSPGLAFTVGIIHSAVPSATGISGVSPTTIAPSVSLILSVILLPFVSVMNALDHFTGYVPFAQSAGTLNVRVMIVASSAAFMPLPMPSPNA